MKKILAIFALFLLITACVNQNSESTVATDSTSVAKDTVVVKADTVKVDSVVIKK